MSAGRRGEGGEGGGRHLKMNIPRLQMLVLKRVLPLQKNNGLSCDHGLGYGGDELI